MIHTSITYASYLERKYRLLASTVETSFVVNVSHPITSCSPINVRSTKYNDRNTKQANTFSGIVVWLTEVAMVSTDQKVLRTHSKVNFRLGGLLED